MNNLIRSFKVNRTVSVICNGAPIHKRIAVTLTYAYSASERTMVAKESLRRANARRLYEQENIRMMGCNP
jgi:hypothetical protein